MAGPVAARRVAAEIVAERARQDVQWGEQNHPDGTGVYGMQVLDADAMRNACKTAFAEGRGTWRHILSEEIGEAYAESDPAKLRVELLQAGAVIAAWVEAIDRRTAASAPGGA
jgi:hypothetical protein